MTVRIVHLTAHLGGGVGRVLKQFTAASQRQGRFIHEIGCLDYANPGALAWSRDTGIAVQGDLCRDWTALSAAIRRADIVHLHWWNHPLTNDLLHRADLPPCRVVLWAHVSGYHAPHVFSAELLDYPDLLVLATPFSGNVPAVQAKPAEWHAARLRTIFATAGCEYLADIRPRAHDQFQIGYIGTVDYCKMHPEYLAMHAAAQIPGARVVVCGGPRASELQRQAEEMGVAARFDVRGHVADVASVLETLDVFGYPLAERHYGASEVALVEAMVAGVPPVVWNNGCEREIVCHGETGLVAGSVPEFAAALEYLYRNPGERIRLGQAARAAARDRFSLSTTTAAWHAAYGEVLDGPKQDRRPLSTWPEASPLGRGTALFLQALGRTPEAELFQDAVQRGPEQSILARLAELPPIFHGQSNGSVRQYRRFFPQDEGLAVCDELLALSRCTAPLPPIPTPHFIHPVRTL